jgi:hypothetical protein
VLYCNDGDWVESLTALAEAADGSLQLITWDRIGAGIPHARAAAAALA